MNLLKTMVVFTAAAVLGSGVHALEFKRKTDELHFKTETMYAVVRNARIVKISTADGKVVFASEKTPEFSRSGGIGNMTGKAKVMSKLHFPWGDPNINKFTYDHFKDFSCYRTPGEMSKLSVRIRNDKIIATWKGLTDGKNNYPADSITITFTSDSSGALEMSASGESEKGGVFGIQIPIENLDGRGKFVLPTFGGVEYAASGEPIFMGFQDSGIFYEAPLMTYVLNNNSLGYWYEDATFRPFFVMVGRNAKASSFGIEINNLMPFEPKKNVSTPIFKINVFKDADFIAAARPYRDWYQKTFAAGIARRDSVKWANKINAISDGGVPSEEELKVAEKFIDPEKVLLHVWQARKLGFTTNIPDYTLREKYPEEVARAHKHGYKVMCYVCALCAVYKSPAWERDNVGEFFLTRKNNISNYNGSKNAFDENLVGTLTKSKGKDQFGHLKPGAFLYGDPLSKRWREYFVNIVKTLNAASGTDANYQDTLGCISENANGIIDGLSGAQGNMQFGYDLLKAMPNTPMASEYGPSPVAMSVKWPLNYAQFWGYRPLREARIHHHRPLTPFLFGYRSWVPVINAGDDFHKHLITACSDALSGMGMYAIKKSMNTVSGFADHLVWRSKIFVDNELVPHYPERRYPDGVISMYRDKNGGIWHYRDDGRLQTMSDPSGKFVYGRVNKSSKVTVKDLELPGWPCSEGDTICGLNPKGNYALFPKSGKKSEFSLSAPPEGAMLKRFFSSKDVAYLEFSGKGKADMTVDYPERFTHMYVNDKLVTDKKVSGYLPLRIVFFSGKPVTPRSVHKINPESGLEQGEPEKLSYLRRVYAGRSCYHIYTGTLNSVMKVENDNDAAEVFFRNVQNKYGNGSTVTLSVNGKVIKTFDCSPSKGKFDTKLRRWCVPLGKFKGHSVLISVDVYNKAQNNADMMFVSIPKKVQDKSGKFSETYPDPDSGSVKNVSNKKRPAGKPAAVIVPEWNEKHFTVAADGTVRSKTKGFFTGKKRLIIDKSKKYYISGKFRSTVKPTGTTYIGVVQLKANGAPIEGTYVNLIPGTSTRLTNAAVKGTEKLMVRDASEWRVGGYVSFNNEMPASYLAGPIVNIEQYGNDWGVFLKKPIKKDIPSDSVTALHMAKATHFYTNSVRLKESFTELGGPIEWWPGAVRYQVLILSSDPVEVKDFKIELFPTDKK